MADPEHVEVVMQGNKALGEWRNVHPGKRLDLSHADLRNAQLGNIYLVEANLENAQLCGANLKGATLQNADLRGANLEGAILSYALLGGTKLAGAYLRSCDLNSANLMEADFRDAVLYGASLQEATMEKVILENTDLRRANVTLANLRNADLTEANIEGANFLEADMSEANFRGVMGIKHARYLETARLRGGDVKYVETCERKWPEYWCDWERLRTMGRLPLFGASYTVLILIPIFYYGLAFYNEKIGVLREWANANLSTENQPLRVIAELVRNRVHEQPIPELSLILLVSTLLLALASTIFALGCPPIIKDFSRSQWCYGLNRSLLHYWAYAWKWRWARLICGVCFVLGGIGALVVIGTKVWNAGCFILRHT